MNHFKKLFPPANSWKLLEIKSAHPISCQTCPGLNRTACTFPTMMQASVFLCSPQNSPGHCASWDESCQVNWNQGNELIRRWLVWELTLCYASSLVSCSLLSRHSDWLLSNRVFSLKVFSDPALCVLELGYVTRSSKMINIFIVTYLPYNPCEDLQLTWLLMQLVDATLTPSTNHKPREFSFWGPTRHPHKGHCDSLCWIGSHMFIDRASKAIVGKGVWRLI